jgi:spore germination cell wall hydrolase CwlJ-like protein
VVTPVRTPIPPSPPAGAKFTPAQAPTTLQSILADASKPRVNEKRTSDDYKSKRERELDFFARTLYGEAGGSSSKQAKEWVAWLIRNRVHHAGFPHSYEGVVTQGNGNQFNCWKPTIGDKDHPETNPVWTRITNPPEKPGDPGWNTWKESMEVAKAIMDAAPENNPIKEAIYYYSPSAQKQLSQKRPLEYPEHPPFVFPENQVGDGVGHFYDPATFDFKFYSDIKASQKSEFNRRNTDRAHWQKQMKLLIHDRYSPDRPWTG